MQIVKSLFAALLTLNLLGAAENYAVGKASQIEIDGVLDEAAWQSVPAETQFCLSEQKGGAAVTMQTAFRVLADAENLYIGVSCQQKEKVRATLKGAQSNPWVDDLVELFFCPSGSPTEFYQIVLSAGGAKWNTFCAEHGSIKPDPYDPAYEFAAKVVDDNKWVLEVKIPFSAFYMTNAAKWQSRWKANVIRYNPAIPENDTWSRLKKNNYDSDRFNTLSGIPAKPGKFDLYLHDAAFVLNEMKGTAGTGTVSAGITLHDKAPKGQYTLQIGEKSFPLNLRSGLNQVKMPGITLEKPGRNMVRFVLRNKAGEVVHDRLYPVIADFTTVKLQFSSPQFAGNFYPGEDASRLVGDVVLLLPEKTVKLSVAGREYTLPVKEGKAHFDIDIKDCGNEIPVAAGGVKTVVRKISDAKAWIRDGKAILNGKAQVLLGWYGSWNWIWSQAMHEKYRSIADKNPTNLPNWIIAEPMRLIPGIEKKEAIYDRKPSPEVFEVYRKLIEKEKNSPYFVYYLSDEPECRGISPVYLRHLYQFIRQQDPTRLVMIISRAPAAYLECADIICPHPYLQPDVDKAGVRTLSRTVATVRDMCKSIGDQNRPDKILMLCPQTFAYTFNDVYADYPDFDETRASVWACIAHRGQGIYPYIWYDHLSRPALDLGCDEIFESLHELEDLIAGGQYTRLQSSNPGVDGALFDNGKEKMILIVNVMPSAQKADVSGAADGEYHRFRETGKMSVSGGKIPAELAPYQVLLLTSVRRDAKLESLSALRKRIDVAEKARHNRGNILHGKGRSIELSYPESSPYTTQVALEQQDKMFDGMTEVSAWQPRNVKGDLWYEMSFPAFVPKFSKARIYGNDLAGMSFKIWKFGSWREPKAIRNESKHCVEFDFGTTLSTVKIRFDFKPCRHLELYEIELLK